MEIKFKSTQKTSNFINWLKGFKEIQTSLIIEADLSEKEFVAKAFPSNKNIVKYSTISFENSGLELLYVSDDEGNEITDWKGTYAGKFKAGDRVKIAIYNILPKFIDVLSMYNEVDNTITIKFSECNNVLYIGAPEPVSEYQAESIQLKSLQLTMNIKCSNISDIFSKCDDDIFFEKVCKIANPTTYEMTSDNINNLIKISNVFGIDKSRDIIKFYTKLEEGGRWGLHAKDDTNDTYDYLMGYFDSGTECEAEMTIYKENFIKALKGIDGDIKATIDVDGTTRMVVDTEQTKIVVAAAKYS